MGLRLAVKVGFGKNHQKNMILMGIGLQIMFVADWGLLTL